MMKNKEKQPLKNIRRNAIINLKKKGVDIEEFKGNSEYINEYIDKLK